MPVRVVILTCALLVASLTGCASATEKYCGAVKGDRAALQRLSSSASDPKSDVVGDSLTIFDDLRDLAPEDVADEWDTFVFAWQGLADELKAAGVDAAGYSLDKRPAGVTEKQYADIKGAAEDLRSARVLDAARGIEDHAKEICKVDLGV